MVSMETDRVGSLWYLRGQRDRDEGLGLMPPELKPDTPKADDWERGWRDRDQEIRRDQGQPTADDQGHHVTPTEAQADLQTFLAAREAGAEDILTAPRDGRRFEMLLHCGRWVRAFRQAGEWVADSPNGAMVIHGEGIGWRPIE